MNLTNWAAAVGMVTGVLGAVLAIINHFRVNKLKRVDEWREAAIEWDRARDKVQSLPEEISEALKWHKSARSATGTFQSGGMQLFQAECDADAERAIDLLSQLDAIDPRKFERLGVETLVRRRIDIANLGAEAESITQKYERSRLESRRELDHYRADIRQRPS